MVEVIKQSAYTSAHTLSQFLMYFFIFWPTLLFSNVFILCFNFPCSWLNTEFLLQFGYPRELWYKIYKRKGHDLIKMKQYLEAREALEVSLKNIGRSDIKKEKDRDNYRMRVSSMFFFWRGDQIPELNPKRIEYILEWNFVSLFQPASEFNVYKSCKCSQIICSRIH